jgi:DNA integrity scanning protein DisA with diadenylate cyclase activity
MLDAVAPLRKPLTLGNELDETTNKNLTDSEAESEILGYFKLDNTLRKQNIERSYQSMETIANVLRLSAGIRDFRQILSSYPHMFFLNVTDILHVTNFLKDEAGMTREDVGKAIQSFPTLLEQDVDKMRAVVEQLQILEVEEDALPAMLRSFPATLLLDTERDVAPVVSFLRDIGIRNIGRFVT